METSAQRPHRGEAYGVIHRVAAQSNLLIDLVAAQIGGDLRRAAELIKLGSVFVGGKRTLRADQSVNSDASFRIHTNPRRFAVSLLADPLPVAFEDEDFLVVNKPAGLPVHALVDNVQENVLAEISKRTKLNLHVTHRLDVGTSGLLVLAKSKVAQAKFNHWLVTHQVEKHYAAVCTGTYTEFSNVLLELGPVWTHYMQPSRVAPKVVARAKIPDWLTCRLKILDYQATESNCLHVRIQLLSGRTHQIRAQLSVEGFPIIGDRLYDPNHAGPHDLSHGFKLCCVGLKWPGQSVGHIIS